MDNNQQQTQFSPSYSDNSPLTVGNFMIMDLLMIVPIVNIVLLFVWAFGGNTNINKKNWAKARLIWLLIAIVFYILLFIVLGASIFSAVNNGRY
ncbi:MAG: hypothetical protein Q8936_21885 [Bacillota bacterium]|nr:hypothetical protein [Bacillota bacterium]